MQVIQAKNLSKTFVTKSGIFSKKVKTKVAVDGVSFAVERGEVYGLLGPNGAGKTTTLRMLSTLLKPDSGDAQICGLSVTENSEEVRQKIGFLTSEMKLEECFSTDYLFDFFSHIYGISDENIAQNKSKLFGILGINEYADQKISQLSTGMKQKSALAVSLANDPDVIIYDEPTNGLDIVATRVVTDFIKDLKSQGKTVIVSTHIFSLIESVCDRVGIMLNGKLADENSLANIHQNGTTLENYFFQIYDKDGDNK